MTDFLPAIAPDQSRQCELCGVYQSVLPGHEEHHMVARSLGGQDTLTLCVACHNKTEGDKPIKVGRTYDYVFALDHTGKLIFQRWTNPPEGFDAGLLIATLQNSPHELARSSLYFRWLPPDAIPAAAEALYNLTEVAWHCRAKLMHIVTMQTPWGEREAVLADMARQFDMPMRTAYRDIEAFKKVEEAGLSAKLAELPPAYVIVEAAKHPEGLAAGLDLYQTRRLEGPYPVEQLRRDVRAGHDAETETEWCHGACTDCGATLNHRRRV